MKILFVGNKSSLYEELYNQLSMHFPVKTAAFFLTGVSDSEKVKTAASLYPKGYILKGVSREELLMKINEFFYS